MKKMYEQPELELLCFKLEEITATVNDPNLDENELPPVKIP